LQ
ncbi:hypothetical protein BV202_01175B, partial [Haemophilus influenzae]|jgi:transcriptional regulator with XRE-family HTH domain